MPIIIRPLVLFHHGPRHYFCWLAVILCLTQDIVYSIIYKICGVCSRFSNCVLLKTYSYVHSYVISVDVNSYYPISDNIIIPYGHVIIYFGRIFICTFSKNIKIENVSRLVFCLSSQLYSGQCQLEILRIHI